MSVGLATRGRRESALLPQVGMARRAVRGHRSAMSLPKLSSLAALVGISLRVLSLRAETTASVPTTTDSGVTVRIATPVAILPRYGFLPVRVNIVNHSPRTGTWQLRFQAGDPSTSIGAIDSRFEVSAEVGERKEVWFYVPLSDAAPAFTMGVPIPPAPAGGGRGGGGGGRRGGAGGAETIRTIAPPPAPTIGVENRARGKLYARGSTAGATAPWRWSARMEPGDRPGETIGVATAIMEIGHGQPPLTGDNLPLGFDSADGIDPAMGWAVRRLLYKETVPDPTGAAAPKSSMLSTLSSSLTAKAAARRALAESGLIKVPPGVRQAVSVAPITSGLSGGQVAWLTTFVQTGSPRLLPLPTGQSVPPGTVVNLHPASRKGEVIRTVTFVEPDAMLGLEKKTPGVAAITNESTLGAEAQALLMRYGYLRPQPEVVVSRTFPGDPDYEVPPQLREATFWFESGPARLLSKPLFGCLPPNTTCYLRPGTNPDEVVRCFAVASRAVVMAAVGGSGVSTGNKSEFQMVVTGMGILGAAEIAFAGLSPSSSSLAPPVAVTTPLAAGFRQTILNAGMRGEPNITPIEAAAMPADWRAWSPFHAVLLTASEYMAYSPEQRAGLRDWVMQGGLLFLEPTTPGPLIGGPLLQERVGTGVITTMAWTIDDYLAPPEPNEDATAWVKVAEPTVLFPLLQFDALALTLPSGQLLSAPPLSRDFMRGDSYWTGKWAALILAAFAFLAGPVNLFRLAPGGRRHRMFFTTPTIALAFAGVLGASILWWDGFGGGGNRAVVVVFVSEEGKAVIYQDQVARTGVLGTQSFPMNDITVMANLSVSNYDATGRSAFLVRGDGMARGDWFRNHWGAAQHLRQLAPTTNWIGVTPGLMAPMVESRMPIQLHSFIYVDGRNQFWYASDVAPGAAVRLQRAALRLWPPLNPGGSKYLDNVLAAAARIEPGRWVALGAPTDLAPIPTLRSIAWRDNIVFTGLATIVGSRTPAPPPPPPPPEEEMMEEIIE